MVQAS
jgi:hypothetical protein